MADRTVKVYLQAFTDDFRREMQKAASETGRVASEFDKNGQKIQTTSGRIKRSAEVNREAWTTAGTALTVFGSAVTAIGIAALNTGIQYNTLQQTTRKALTTLLGDAKAANAQMDLLDDFARNSPFAKQVFIQAQQQMLGFGIEASKVIPYLSAIEDSVAAFGGSNQQISEIATVFAKIEAQGKITARELMQLGTSGINAAELIAVSMGTTADVIRDQITAGTLDASVALDALADGMSTNFGGAAAGLKDTFEGALDRVKAAWRDLSSELAEPLVSQSGGGLLVDLTNALADAMRWFQSLPEPIKATVAAMGGLTAAGALTGGAFLLLLPRILDTREAIGALTRDFPAFVRGLKTGGAAAVVATGLFVALSASYQRAVGSHRELIGELMKGIEELDSVGLDDRMAAFRAELEAPVRMDHWGNQLNPVLRIVNGLADRDRNQRLAELGDALAYANAATAGSTQNLILLREESGYAYDELERLANLHGIDLGFAANTDEARMAREELLRVADAANNTGGAYAELTGELIDYSQALRDNIDLNAEAAGVVMDHRTAVGRFHESVREATATLEENGATLDLTTEAGYRNDQALQSIADSAHLMMASMDDAGMTTEEMREQMILARDSLVDAAKEAGATARQAEELADSFGLIPEFVGITVRMDVSQALRAMSSVMGSMDAVQRHNYITARNTYADGGTITGMAGGGTVPGYSPSPRADNIPIMATAGEFMQPVVAVDFWGPNAMEAMRRRDVAGLWQSLSAKGFADGGRVVSSGRSMAVASAAAPSMSLEGATIVAQFGEHQFEGVVASISAGVQTGSVKPQQFNRAGW